MDRPVFLLFATFAPVGRFALEISFRYCRKEESPSPSDKEKGFVSVVARFATMLLFSVGAALLPTPNEHKLDDAAHVVRVHSFHHRVQVDSRSAAFKRPAGHRRTAETPVRSGHGIVGISSHGICRTKVVQGVHLSRRKSRSNPQTNLIFYIFMNHSITPTLHA